MFLFFSVARSQEIGSGERAMETTQGNGAVALASQQPIAVVAPPSPKPAPKTPPKNGVNPNFGMNLPMMNSAFDTAAWLQAA
jgi:hypothetical protein